MSEPKRSRPFYCNLPQNPDTVNIADSEAAFEVIHDECGASWQSGLKNTPLMSSHQWLILRI